MSSHESVRGTNADEQRARQSAARLARQRERASKHFRSGSNPHHGSAISNSGAPKR